MLLLGSWRRDVSRSSILTVVCCKAYETKHVGKGHHLCQDQDQTGAKNIAVEKEI